MSTRRYNDKHEIDIGDIVTPNNMKGCPFADFIVTLIHEEEELITLHRPHGGTIYGLSSPYVMLENVCVSTHRLIEDFTVYHYNGDKVNRDVSK
jgi:hypothetical protein